MGGGRGLIKKKKKKGNKTRKGDSHLEGKSKYF